jgi:nitrite reductase/ring-hydroxylating ferredoxin subunit
VAPVADLAEGASLRADLNGVIVAVVRFDGNYYAFQEFCTHRYGPLSEGRLHDGQVECPWHGSCFDVRTGRVTRGPAKVDLNTYRVLVNDGMIFVDLRQSTPVERERLQQMVSGNGRGQRQPAANRPA